MRKYSQFHNLPVSGQTELGFLQSCLFESLAIEQALQDSARRLATMEAPVRIKPEVHSVLDDQLSAMDALIRLQRNMGMMFMPGAKFSTATRFASQCNYGGLTLDSKEVKLWESLNKVHFQYVFFLMSYCFL